MDRELRGLLGSLLSRSADNFTLCELTGQLLLLPILLCSLKPPGNYFTQFPVGNALAVVTKPQWFVTVRDVLVGPLTLSVVFCGSGEMVGRSHF